MKSTLLAAIFITLSVTANDLRRGNFNIVDNNQNDLVDQIYDKCSSEVDMKLVAENNAGAIEGLKNCINKYGNSFEGFEDKAALVKIKDNEGRAETAKQSAVSIKLGDYLDEKFSTSLRGKDGKQIVDHNNYYDIYRSQLSKNITLHVNSYCLEGDFSFLEGIENTNPPTNYNSQIILISSDKDKARSFNSAILSKTILVQKDYGESNGGTKPVPLQQAMIENCIGSLRDVCDAPKPKRSDPQDQNPKYHEESKRRACVVLQNLRSINKSLDKLEGIIAEMNGRKRGGFKRIDAEKRAIQLYSAGDPENGIDALTSLTSADFDKKVKEKLEESECAQLQDEECQDQLGLIVVDDLDPEEQKKALAKQAIKTGIVSYGLENANQEELEKILKAEGYEDIIANIEGDVEKKLKNMRDSIQENYETERLQALERMKEQLNEGQQNIDNIDTIKKSLGQSSEYVSQLLFFNNIITGYLEITGGEQGEANSRNIASFDRELRAQREAGTGNNIEQLEDAFRNLQQEGGEIDTNPATPTIDAETVRTKIIRDISSEDAKADTTNPNGP